MDSTTTSSTANMEAGGISSDELPQSYTAEPSEEDEESGDIPDSVIIVIYSLIGLLIITGNILVLIVVYRRKAMRMTTNILVGSLSFANLMIGCFVIPSTIINIAMGNSYTGTLTCVLVPYVQLASITASILSMVLIAIERYHVIVMYYKPSFTPRATTLMVASVWLISAMYSLRVLIPLGSHSDDDDDGDGDGDGELLCDMMQEDSDSDLYWRVTDLVMINLIPLCIMVVLYGTIKQRLWSTTNNLDTTRNQNSLGQKRRTVKVIY